MKVICYVIAGLVFSASTVLSQRTTYSFDDSAGFGRRFDGVGAISGGGATSRLLVNYPVEKRKDILDFLFKPNFGASLHIFKVEIGGDAQSSDGGEASHMHESWDENYERGYEWWLMTEAKKRNPDIKLYGLPWAFPAWIGNGTYNAYANPEVTADYIIRWITAAKTRYNLKLDFIGIWNERNYSATYIKTLRKMMDSRDLAEVKICAPDQHGWKIADNMVTDRELKSAVDFIGTHYPDSISDQSAVNSGKQLWASEDHGFGGEDPKLSGACRARMLNLNYINGLMTSTISWNLITSYYPGLPFTGSGLMTAVEPWSGNYVVDAPVWITAHTTQFTLPGWEYLKHGSGVGKLMGGGSYVAFADDAYNLTIVIETMTKHADCIESPYASGPQNVTFTLKGSFSRISTLYVWYTKLRFDGNPSTYFQELTPIHVYRSNIVELSLGVDEVFTLTTMSTGGKGTAADPPPSQPFPLPYGDNFEDYPVSGEANNFAQQIGVWEVTEVGPPHSQVIRQVVLQHPVYWCWGGVHPENNTLNLIGNYEWRNISIEVDFRVGSVNGSDGVYVGARIDRGGCHASQALGIFFIIFPNEQRYELTNDLARQKVLRSGPAPVGSEWNTLFLQLRNDAALGILNGNPLFDVAIPDTPTNGFAGLGTISYGLADFDNFVLKSVF